MNERVPEPLEGPADHPAPDERRHEHRQERSDRRRLEGEDPVRRGRIDRHAGRPEPPVEEDLGEQAAERVADEDGRLREVAHQAVVVIDDLADPRPASGDGSARISSIGRSLPGHAGAMQRYPSPSKYPTNGSQQLGVTHAPWMKTMVRVIGGGLRELGRFLRV